MMSEKLSAYLELERKMLKLDAEDDPAADGLRDEMDPLWYAMSEEEHLWLDNRPNIGDEKGEG